jgi:iron complex transport system ATP-binding protein
MPSVDLASAASAPLAPVFQTDSVSLRRGARLVLDQVSCAALPGRVLAVLGPNGAGKSTLLRLLAGDFRPAAGSVTFAGRPLSAWSVGEIALRRAVVAQHSDLAFPFTVGEVVRLGRTPHPGRGDAPADHAAAARALAAVDLSDRAAQSYPTLSGGERQRVHFARALAQLDCAPSGPRALLLDEPTASLDLAHQHSVLGLARDLARRENIAVFAVLHDLNLALAYADDLLALVAGRMVAAGPITTTLTTALVREVFGIHATLHPAREDTPAHLAFVPSA